jgi:nitrate/TMAO reductase-like tetraheme cytochrome c subunit
VNSDAVEEPPLPLPPPEGLNAMGPGKLVAIGVVALLLVAALALAAARGFERTSTTEYCLSCHEIRSRYDELQQSVHARNWDGRRMECRSCHVPKRFGLKLVAIKLLAVKDLWVHYAVDADRLDRRAMQRRGRRVIPDENCLVCHEDLYRNTRGEEISEIGRLGHEAYLGKNGTTRRNCAGCHLNIAHLPEFDRRYPFNAEFAERLPLEREDE